ncbi:MAG: SRPBCC domain-containing protein [Chloroflexota bacterium]
MTASVESIGRRRRLVRTYPTSLQHAWDLWTTPEGIARWWGPDGFHVEVQRMELRVGGTLEYWMVCDDPQIRAFLAREGMPERQLAVIRYTEIVPLRRLAYANVVDFVPGIEPYEAGTLVELEPTAQGVQLTLTLDAMHDDAWTDRAVAGWQQELGKLARSIEEA